MLDIGKLPEPHRSMLLKVISMQTQMENITPENQINPSLLGDDTLQILSELALNVSNYLSELAAQFQEEMVKRVEGETENKEEIPVDETGSGNETVVSDSVDTSSNNKVIPGSDDPLTPVKGPT
jgi:hypothetical protein